jgi:VCBS repeat-containing protein
MTTSPIGKRLILLAILLIGAPASANQLVTASLKNGNYGTGTAVPPTNGVVATPDGVRFIPTEASGRSSALVNWQIGNNSTWRRTGTITFLFKATRGQLAAGEILGDNYGFGQFHNGQSAFSASASHAPNGAGPDDDRVSISWKSWHAGVWYIHSVVQIEYDKWYSLGFAWGGPAAEFEIWVNQVRKSAVNIAGSFPWGLESPPSGFNMGLGDNHERGVDSYNSAAGVMFADIRMWNEYRALGDTVDPNHAPTTVDDAYGLDEDSSLSIGAPGVLSNDTDQDGQALTAALVSDVSNGTLTLNGDGSFSYQPNAGYHGSDSFTYEASDGDKAAEATVTITISSVNDAPVANADTASTLEDVAVSIDAMANDTDADHDPLQITQAGASDGGVTFDEGGLLFTPPANFFGPVVISYTLIDGQGGTAQGSVSVTVTPVNDPPATNDLTVDTVSPTAVTVTLTGTDIDSSSLTFEPGAAIGGTVIGTSPTFTFTPAAGFSGTGGFSFVVRDDQGLMAPGTVTVNVAPAPVVNHSPIAVDDTAGAVSGAPTTIAVLGNDSDPDGDALTLVGASGAVLGTVTVAGSQVQYQAEILGGLEQAIAALDGLSHGERTSLLARLRNALRALARGQVDLAMESLDKIAGALARFARDGNSAAAARIVAMLRSLAAGTLTDLFTYAISDGRGGTASAQVTIAIALR